MRTSAGAAIWQERHSMSSGSGEDMIKTVPGPEAGEKAVQGEL
jgi:hypothetical protein